MNDEEKISKNLLILMFVSCIILLAAVSASIIFYSPKTVEPSFSEAEVVEETEVVEDDSDVAPAPEELLGETDVTEVVEDGSETTEEVVETETTEEAAEAVVEEPVAE